jgi:DNA-binding transcriptional regulator GbsR (MarR family)
MPKGDATTTDKKFLARLEKFSRPVTVNELTSRLRWSRGKIDGAINRLQDKKSVAVVKVSFPRGQRMRYIGLPNKPYWEGFYTQMIVEQQNVLVNDSLGILSSYGGSEEHIIETQSETLRNYQKTVDNLRLQLIKNEQSIKDLQQQLVDKNQQIQDLEQQRSRIDPSIAQVIEEHLNLISEAANQKGFSPAELLENRIPLILNENIDLFSKIVSIVADDSRKEDDSIEGTAARSILRRAGLIDHR